MSRNVTGPQSALTDFLAANNISANRIRLDANRRRAAVEAQNQSTAAAAEEESNEAEVTTASGADSGGEDASVSIESCDPGPSTRTRSSRSRPDETEQQQTKRKADEKNAIEKIKASKAFKKRARHARDDDEADDMARALFEERSKPLPGQMDNCEICKKRFTVTPYSRAGPQGGLLCAQCSRDSDKGKGPPKKKPRQSTGGIGRRRNIQSRIMDGTYHLGAKNLMRLCIETLACNVHLADDLGELPPHVVDKIARLFSKRRLLNPKTLPLFVRATTEVLSIYSAAYLGTDDLISIFQTCSRLRELRIRDGIHFKDEVMDYVLGRKIQLEKLSLHGANLLSSDRWQKFLAAKGEHLKTLQVYATDKHFGDQVVAALGSSSPNLRRLKIDGNQELTSDGAKNIADIKSLQHLSLRLLQKVTTKSLVHTVRGVGANLVTLSLKGVPDANDEVLTAIKNNCTALQKLRVTLSEHMTDEGFVDMFTDWRNEPLLFIDFEGCRQLDAQHPRENVDKIGLCSDGFRAMMAHSGRNLRRLTVAACRHISKAAFEEVFAEDKVYKDLRLVDVSFCEEVDDFVVGCILRCCPALQQLKVFGCMKVTSHNKLPPNVMLIGVPNAMGNEIVGR